MDEELDDDEDGLVEDVGLVEVTIERLDRVVKTCMSEAVGPIDGEQGCATYGEGFECDDKRRASAGGDAPDCGKLRFL